MIWWPIERSRDNGAGMTKLSVNVNKVALLRNTRDHSVPSVVQAARTCIEAGADGITVHPRPDQRHITPQDVHDLKALLATDPRVEYNLEGNPFEGPYVDLVIQIQPTQATLVPDTPNQRTSDHGWNIAEDGARLAPVIQHLHEAGIRVSLFMDADPQEIAKVTQTGADRIELYTESYATAYRSGDFDKVLARFVEAACEARRSNLGINAGHDLNRDNLGPLLTQIPDILEVSIGHELVADALWLGLAETVKAYLRAVGGRRGG